MTRYLPSFAASRSAEFSWSPPAIPRVVAREKANEAVIVGEYSDPHSARRAMLLGLQGLRPRFNPLSDPRFKSRQAS